MTEPLTTPALRLLGLAEAAQRLRPAGGRGFLGLDPTTQNGPLLVRLLAGLDAQVFQAGDTLVGSAPNRQQPRQAYVATTSADPVPVHTLLSFLADYQRTTSYVALVPSGSPAVDALLGNGFRQVGTLPAHRYAAERYAEVTVYFAGSEEPCRS